MGAKMQLNTRAARSETRIAKTFFCILHFMHMNAVYGKAYRRY